MHAESGYWRPKPDGTIEVVIAQSNGLVEVQVLFANLIWFCVMDTLFDQLASCVSIIFMLEEWWVWKLHGLLICKAPQFKFGDNSI